MMKVICSRFSTSRWKIDRRSFSRSFSAKAPRVSAKAISKRYSKRSRKSKTDEVICNPCHVERSRNISNYSLGLASVANVERSFDSAQDDNLKGGSTCHF